MGEIVARYGWLILGLTLLALEIAAPGVYLLFFGVAALAIGANVLIFPDLNAANTSYKLMQRLGGAEAIGPVLMGMAKPVHILLPSDDVRGIVNMAAIAVVDAQMRALA